MQEKLKDIIKKNELRIINGDFEKTHEETVKDSLQNTVLGVLDVVIEKLDEIHYGYLDDSEWGEGGGDAIRQVEEVINQAKEQILSSNTK